MTRRAAAARSATGDERGLSLIEVLVSMAIVLVISGALFTLLAPSQGIFQSQPEVSDMQQRMRVGVHRLYTDLVLAGAGPYAGPVVGPLGDYFAPVVPYRAGARDPDPPQTFRRDVMSTIHVPEGAAQATIRDPVVQPSPALEVEWHPACPVNDPLCGFRAGMTVLIFDGTGASDTFTVAGVEPPLLRLQLRGAMLSRAYAPGASIVEVSTRTYYLDRANSLLRQYDGLATDVPLVDDVVDLDFRYFGDPRPPASPRPPPGVENCLFDGAGNATLPVLAASGGSLVELTEALLTSGPTCGAGSGAFDADLYRLRQVRVSLRVQVTSPELRGADRRLFRQPGISRSATRIVPDYEMRVDVAPRNLNLAR